MKIRLGLVIVLSICRSLLAIDDADALRMTNKRPTSKVLHNADVLWMMKRTAPASEIIRQINIKQPGFRLLPENVQYLRDKHVPEAVITAMFERNLNTDISTGTEGSAASTLPSSQLPPRRGAALIVKEGTQVRLRLTENLNATYLRLDDKVHFEVLEDVLVANQSGRFRVISREAKAEGTITAVKRTYLMGHYGIVEVALDSVVLANGDRVAIRATEIATRHLRPGLIVFLTAPIGVVVQPKDPIWLKPVPREEAILKDGSDFVVWTDGMADLDSAEFEQR